MSNVATAPALPFGHGLSYTTHAYDNLTRGQGQVDTAGLPRPACCSSATSHEVVLTDERWSTVELTSTSA